MQDFKVSRKFWELPELTNINRLPAHSCCIPFHDFQTAKVGDKNTSEFFRSLDGQWKFTLLQNTSATPDVFPSEEFDDSSWGVISVPSYWTMQNFCDKPIYTNINMPFDNNPPFVPEENPTGLYRCSFDVPDSWAGRRVVLHIGGADSVLEVFVNGKFVGMGKDSRLPSEFDLTGYTRLGRNLLAVRVIKWSDSSYIEDQDQWWQAGISRSVYIYSTPYNYIEDIYARGDYNPEDTTCTLDVKTKLNIMCEDFQPLPKAGENYTVTAELFDNTGIRIFSGQTEINALFRRGNFSGQITGHVMGALPWSAEMPVLYRLVITLRNCRDEIIDIRSLRIGFCRVEITDRKMLINGKAVMINGVNRHEHDDTTGKTISREAMLKDILMLKQFNFNAVRTSHYPNCEEWYDLCDEYGLYVMDEANIESHANYPTICRNPRWKNAFVERCTNMVMRDRNHPCIFSWSLGNESGFGENHIAAAQEVRQLDMSRPIHYEGEVRRDLWQGESDFVDVNPFCNAFADTMYPTLELLENWVKNSNDRRPFITCEYADSMGNSSGSLREYFEMFEKYDGLQGGFIWEWMDLAIKKIDGNGKEYWAYGGDFGETIHDSNFCCDGLIWPDRTPHPGMYEYKKLAQPIGFEMVDVAEGKFRIRNKQYFRDISWLCGKWSITVDGVEVSAGKLPPLTASAGDMQEINLAGYRLPNIKSGQECFVNFSVMAKNATTWCDAGYEIASEQFAISSKPTLNVDATCFEKAGSVTMHESHDIIKVSCDKMDVEFSRKTGESSISFGGKLIIPHGPQLNVWRACIDNDGIRNWTGQDNKPMGQWLNAGFDKKQLISANVSYAKDGSSVIVCVKRTWAGKDKSKPISHEEIYSILPTGEITVLNVFNYDESLPSLPRVGVMLSTCGGFEWLKWFGRGPFENYVDRNYAAHVGLYESTVGNQYVPYILPQEHGNKTDVRWFELSDGATIIKFSGCPMVEFSASHFTATDLFVAQHTNELIARKETFVTLDLKQRGLGTGSCGPQALEQYCISPGHYQFSYKISLR